MKTARPDKDICEEITKTYEAYKKEIVEHKIEQLAGKQRVKILRMIEDGDEPGKIKLSREIEKLQDYEDMVKSFREVEKLYTIACGNEEGFVDCDLLEKAKKIWQKERKKYTFIIKLFGKVKHYENVQKGIDDAYAKICEKR